MSANQAEHGSEGAQLTLAERYASTEDQPMTGYGLLGRLAYKASYGVSFGLVYPVAMVARMLPRENALMYGLHDGATAARDEAFGLLDRRGTGSNADPIIQAS